MGWERLELSTSGSLRSYETYALANCATTPRCVKSWQLLSNRKVENKLGYCLVNIGLKKLNPVCLRTWKSKQTPTCASSHKHLSLCVCLCAKFFTCGNPFGQTQICIHKGTRFTSPGFTFLINCFQSSLVSHVSLLHLVLWCLHSVNPEQVPPDC
jgi:hypothetical protein